MSRSHDGTSIVTKLVTEEIRKSHTAVHCAGLQPFEYGDYGDLHILEEAAVFGIG